jgi:hypothetical protein
MVLSLCREFHVLPSQLLAEDAYLLKLLHIEKLGHPEREEVEDYR